MNNFKIMEEEYWKVISMLDWSHEGDDEEVLKPAVEYLATKSNE